MDPETAKPVNFQTNPIGFLSNLFSSGKVRKAGLAVLGAPFGATKCERIWKVLTAVESKKRGRLSVITSNDQMMVTLGWETAKEMPELVKAHGPGCRCKVCKPQ